MAIAHDLRLRNVAHPRGWRTWGASVARSLYAGVLVGMIAGFVTLLVSIVSIVAGEMIFHRLLIDVPLIYRQIAPTVALAVAVATSVGNLVWERTHPAPAPAERT